MNIHNIIEIHNNLLLKIEELKNQTQYLNDNHEIKKSVKNLIKTYDEFTLILQQLQNFIE
jgi:hypothetical protein